MQGRLIRAREDSFSETAMSDDAVRAITQMQGLRMSRKLPCDMQVTLTSTINVTLDPFTQFTISGQSYFNREQLTLIANVAQTVDLNEGVVNTYSMSGLGSPRQTFLTDEDSFTVSDTDVRVFVNSTQLPRSLGTLWNFSNLPAFSDLTTSDGRLLVIFGSEQFGTTPQVTDNVVVQYVVTQGTNGASATLVGKPISVTGFSYITGVSLANPTGGGDEQPIQTYKNLSSGAFGTYSSAVTKSQYQATIGVYSGIIDSVTQAQRDINPLALQWMNVIRISALTNTPWSQDQIRDYINYLQTVTMYACRFVWQDPIAVPRTVDLTVYCFNSAILSQVQAACIAAITELFSPRPGILLTNFYNSDLINACVVAGAGAVSYVIVSQPIDPMIVTAPLSPELEYQLVPGGGTLGELVYAYAVTTVNAAGEEGPPNNWVFPQVIGPTAADAVILTWQPLQDVVTYKIYGRTASGTGIGLLGTVGTAGPYTFTDNGSITPTGLPPNSIADVPIRYNSLASLTVNVQFAERQQRLATNTPTRSS